MTMRLSREYPIVFRRRPTGTYWARPGVHTPRVRRRRGIPHRAPRANEGGGVRWLLRHKLGLGEALIDS
jgi:hypothetical protein